jgi:quercetin dioxygenase-like cupin family protein
VIPADAVHATYNDTDEPAKILAILSPAVAGDGYAAVDVSGEEPWSGLRR